jgi:hypothetical protein
MNIKVITASATGIVLLGGVLGVQQYISSQITASVEREIPKATGVTASVPLAHIPSNLTSNSIKFAKINIESFALKESGTKTSLDISLSNISKSKPTQVGSLEVIATIPASTITKLSEFNDAQIVGNNLQVSTGAGGIGTALLAPKYLDGKLYFELKSISFLDQEIRAESLPAELQDQIKSKSQRSLTPPKGLKVKSVSLSSKGLSVKMFGKNIELGNLGSGL